AGGQYMQHGGCGQTHSGYGGMGGGMPVSKGSYGKGVGKGRGGSGKAKGSKAGHVNWGQGDNHSGNYIVGSPQYEQQMQYMAMSI
ncbi:unnamed protein product, partial [Polarella glacialis]